MSVYDLDVIILKPTSVFLSFISSQLPDLSLPNLNEIQSDNTAYSLVRQKDEEATLDEIERHFPTMFRHELSKWIGEEACQRIECSFLDFLCCFKFKLHSQIVLMESNINEAHQLFSVKPRSVLLKWIKSALSPKTEDEKQAIDFLNLSHIQENATLFIKNFGASVNAKRLINHYYRPLYKVEMTRMHDDEKNWPNIDSYQTFNRYFSVDIHSELIHLH